MGPRSRAWKKPSSCKSKSLVSILQAESPQGPLSAFLSAHLLAGWEGGVCCKLGEVSGLGCAKVQALSAPGGRRQWCALEGMGQRREE